MSHKQIASEGNSHTTQACVLRMRDTTPSEDPNSGIPNLPNSFMLEMILNARSLWEKRY